MLGERWVGARGSVVCWGTVLQVERSRVQVPMRCIYIYIYFFFSIYLVLPTELWPSAFIRNEYQKSSWWVKSGRCVSLTALPPSVSRLSKENVRASTCHGLLQGYLYLTFRWATVGFWGIELVFQIVGRSVLCDLHSLQARAGDGVLWPAFRVL
jgi:hypothetical protein